LPPLVVAAGAALGIVLLLLVLYKYVLPHRGSDTASAKSDTSAEKSADPAAAAGSTHPLAKLIEVSGVRIQESSAGKVKIDFNVVNHSSGDLPELKLDVRLRSGNRDFFDVPVKLPSLAPYASKDLSTTVKTDLKPYELPDWQRVEPRFTVQDADR